MTDAEPTVATAPRETGEPARRVRVGARDLALIAVFAAFVAVMGLPGALFLPGNTVPITAQTLGVLLAGAVIGPWRAAAAVLVFHVLVAAGLPLLSGGRGGLAVFSGPGAGYLFGWILGAFVTGWVVRAWRRGRPVPLFWFFVGTLAGTLAIYLLGVPGVAIVVGVSLAKAFTLNLAYLPGDALKLAVAAIVAGGVHRGYPALLAPRRTRP